MKRLFRSNYTVNKNRLDLRQTVAAASGIRVRRYGTCGEKALTQSVLPLGYLMYTGYTHSMQRTETRGVCMLLPDIWLNPLSQQSGWNVSDALITHKCHSVLVSGARPARGHSLPRSLARSLAFKLFLYLGNPSLSRVSRRSRLGLLAGKVRRRAVPQRCTLTSTAAVPVNARNPITSSWTWNEIAFVAAWITRAPPDSFSRHNESNFFSLPT